MAKAKRKQLKNGIKVKQMKCSHGDLAIILFSIRPENIGRIVRVKEYIGQFDEGETFQFRGMPCRCAVSDHYWWIGADDITIMYGPAPKAYIADSWLEPIRPEDLDNHSQETQDLERAA
jgi:hypothetical protein